MLKSELEDALFAAEAKAGVRKTVEDIIIVDLHDMECAFCEDTYNTRYRVQVGTTVFYFCDGCIDDFTKVIVALGFAYNPHSKNRNFRFIVE